jgi:hypothetical protein
MFKSIRFNAPSGSVRVSVSFHRRLYRPQHRSNAVLQGGTVWLPFVTVNVTGSKLR